jgi:AbrB family looped-hinge helix DNA binding protein
VFALSAEEAEFTAYVRRNGRMTVPKEVRDALGIEEGNLVKCKIRTVET